MQLGMGWTEPVLIGIAAVVLALNQALKDAPELTGRVQFLKPKGWWNYIPLGLVIVAGVVWLLPGSIEENAATSVSSPDFPLRAVQNAFEGRTNEEGKRIIASYNDRPAKITGVIQDVRIGDSVGEKFAIVAIEDGFLSRGVYLTFESAQAEGASLFRVGDKITAGCIFDADSTDRIGLNFRDCELLDGPHSEAMPS
jgi:hypothetical protein